MDSPVAALSALQYGYVNMNLRFLKTLFTDDFMFVFSPLDSAGTAYEDDPWNRDDEVPYMEHLFSGGGGLPPAELVTLDFTNSLVDIPSPRPGHHPTWHRVISAEVNLRVRAGDLTREVRGPGQFYFVRGDSAVIPAGLVGSGFTPDSTRWWIERWEDATVSLGATRAMQRPDDIQPAQNVTWGAVKALYREPLPLE